MITIEEINKTKQRIQKRPWYFDFDCFFRLFFVIFFLFAKFFGSPRKKNINQKIEKNASIFSENIRASFHFFNSIINWKLKKNSLWLLPKKNIIDICVLHILIIRSDSIYFIDDDCCFPFFFIVIDNDDNVSVFSIDFFYWSRRSIQSFCCCCCWFVIHAMI